MPCRQSCLPAGVLLTALLLCAVRRSAARALQQADDPAAYSGTSPADLATQAQARPPDAWRWSVSVCVPCICPYSLAQATCCLAYFMSSCVRGCPLSGLLEPSCRWSWCLHRTRPLHMLVRQCAVN